MKNYLFVLFLIISGQIAFSQSSPDPLTVQKIMRDPKWMGTSPSAPYWSSDSKYLFFGWNPEKNISDSAYYISKDNYTPQKASFGFQHAVIRAWNASYNNSRTAYTFSKDGDIFVTDIKSGKQKRVTQTNEEESDPVFSFDDTKIVYSRNQNLYAWDIATGLVVQLTDFRRGHQPKTENRDTLNKEEKWLTNEALENSEVLQSRKEKRDMADSFNKTHKEPEPIKPIYIGDERLNNVTISPDGKYITYRLMKFPKDAKHTIVPDYVTESGYTEDIPGRTKVGSPQLTTECYVFDTGKDSSFKINTDQIPGITDVPGYLKYYPSNDSTKKKSPMREVTINGPIWSPKGAYAVVDIHAHDNKDRWLMLLDAATGKLKLLDRQHDEAWIGGPGIGYLFGGGTGISGWINENTFWYQSEEATGYSHLYKTDVVTGEKTALTSGKYEVQQAQLSADKKYFYIITNEVHPGEQQFYKLPVNGGKAERITTMTGGNEVSISPDEKQIAILYSYTNKPTELYVQENKPGGKLTQITHLAMSDEFKSYKWQDPEVIAFTARDGAQVYARLYRPSVESPAKPGVLFVHGAGYLQDAHKWWSYYFREFMFNNMLADNGYTVMDVDYRGSAGYGRDWRTGIYRHMGGKDLDDEVDAAKYMAAKLGVNPKHIGMYGGSYGGFMTLMALFTAPDVFAAGAAIRSVTDWSHYNHGYTSDILNEPFTDSMAYKQSSPIYFANGLKGHLLMLHGMVDQNVHFQDIVRLTQRLIELGKDNWELAVYPMEDHGFVEPSSWTDEYKRIFKLFETTLK
ncbi:MAG: S9 family peptidase [Bacteroidetes bacterium]|nr:S9 family peptidase [Bacteroidota bacterium]MBS1974290.1 S9 family peptidase [Bacteroidota bacterium]